MVETAKKGMGIIGCYENMTIIKDSGLKNILPNIRDKIAKWYFVYPNHLKSDVEITIFKNYINKKFL